MKIKWNLHKYWKYWKPLIFPIFPPLNFQKSIEISNISNIFKVSWNIHRGIPVHLQPRKSHFHKTFKILEIFEKSMLFWKFIGNYWKYWKYQGIFKFQYVCRFHLIFNQISITDQSEYGLKSERNCSEADSNQFGIQF